MNLDAWQTYAKQLQHLYKNAKKLWNAPKHNSGATETPPGTHGLLNVYQGAFLTHLVSLHLAGHLKFSCNLARHSIGFSPALPRCTLP